MRAFITKRPITIDIVFSVMFVFGALTSPVPLPAQSASMLTSISANHQIADEVERMELTVKTSRILSLGSRIPRFQVQDEDVLDATPVSDHKIQISAKQLGTTQVNVWDTQDKIYTIDVTVVADAGPIENLLNSQLPLASLKVTPVHEAVVVSGLVTRAEDVGRAIAIVEQFYATVISNIQVAGTPQVILHTRIMEVSCTKLRQLGLQTPWCSTSPRSGETKHCFRVDGHFESLIQALEKQQLVKILAAPSVVATHGQHTRFVVGGRVPSVSYDNAGQLNVAYEEYGTSIDFMPLVIGPDRIRLQVRPELSEPDPSRSVTTGTTHVSAFTTRYVETSVEMQMGQTVLLAGLMQSRDESVLQCTPVLSEVPVIGKLFRKVHCQHNQIELLITITAEIVDATGFASSLESGDLCQFEAGVVSTTTEADEAVEMKAYDDSEGMIDYHSDGTLPSF